MKALHQDLARALYELKLDRRELGTIRHIMDSLEPANSWKIHWAIIDEMKKGASSTKTSTLEVK